jgi:putative acetyltransferase
LWWRIKTDEPSVLQALPPTVVDFAYIRPEAQHTGLFRQLLSQITATAIERGEPLLWTHASLMAEPAFRTLGFTIRKREEVTIGKERLERFEMERRLSE